MRLGDPMSATAALESMNGKLLNGRPIVLNPAFKKQKIDPVNEDADDAVRRQADAPDDDGVEALYFLEDDGSLKEEPAAAAVEDVDVRERRPRGKMVGRYSTEEAEAAVAEAAAAAEPAAVEAPEPKLEPEQTQLSGFAGFGQFIDPTAKPIVPPSARVREAPPKSTRVRKFGGGSSKKAKRGENPYR